MYDHIYRMLETGPSRDAEVEVIKLDRVFYADNSTSRATATANYRPLIYQADLRDYLTALDARLTAGPAEPTLPSAAAELDLYGILDSLSDVSLDRVAQAARDRVSGMELSTLAESSCEATVRLGAALILLGFAIDRYRN